MVCEQIRSDDTTTKEYDTKQKNQKEEDYMNIKIHKNNQDWNDWKFQVHWNKLEWVNPSSRVERKHSFCVSFKSCLKDNVKNAHWVLELL